MRPDITPAQIVGLLTGGLPVLANLLRAFGVFDLSQEQEQALHETMQWAAVVAGALFVSDAGVRIGRNLGLARGAPVELQRGVDKPGPGR